MHRTQEPSAAWAAVRRTRRLTVNPVPARFLQMSIFLPTFVCLREVSAVKLLDGRSTRIQKGQDSQRYVT